MQRNKNMLYYVNGFALILQPKHVKFYAHFVNISQERTDVVEINTHSFEVAKETGAGFDVGL
jgi:hypothetical protein